VNIGSSAWLVSEEMGMSFYICNVQAIAKEGNAS
jgi:hypothetical protein